MSWGMYYMGDSQAVLKKAMDTRAYPEYGPQTAQLIAVKGLIQEVIEGIEKVLHDATTAAGGTPEPIYLDLKASGHMDSGGNFNFSLEIKRIHLEF